MDDSHIGCKIIYFSLISIACIATLWLVEVQHSILPKFISASYKNNLTLNFNSIALTSIYNFISIILDKPSEINLLVGDIPLYDKRKNETYIQKYNYNDEQTLIKNIIKDYNFSKISMSNSNEYHLFPNSDKTKMNVLSFALEDKKDKTNKDINICFTKLSTITLYEIPIDNFIIDFQNEYKLEHSFFKLKWKLNIPGIIIKYVFSPEYNYLALVYKQIKNGIEVSYKIVYIDINNSTDNMNLSYEVIDIPGNTKIMALAVEKDLIIYSRKIDKYKLNILYKKGGIWNRFSENEIKYELERYFIISDLKFIRPNQNNVDNVNNLFLFVKGIVSDINGIRMFMKIITIDLNIIFNNTDNNDHEKNNNPKFFVNSKDILNSFLELYYFEAKDFNLYENFTYDMNNLEIGKLHKRFKKLNEPIIFNKYIQKGENSNFLHFQFLSNITLETFYMNSSYFSSFPNINLNPDEYITKKNNEELIKICGDNYYVVEDKNNILSFFTLNITNNDDPSNGLFFDNPRRISFISLPKNFKFSKIYDYYFDKFNEKIILFLLIDEGLIVSLDFTGSINQKNAGATFYRDQFNFWKTTVLFINCFSLFLYFLDWSIVDKISRDIKNFIIAHFPLFNGQLFSNDLENNLRRDNWLQLSNSNTSLLSLNSNDESNNLEEEFSNSNNNININNSGSNIIRLRRRNIFEDDVFDHIPCI
jgi:hypothetical protein